MSTPNPLSPEHVAELEAQIAQLKAGMQPLPLPPAPAGPPVAHFVPPAVAQPAQPAQPPASSAEQSPQLEELARARFLAFEGPDKRPWFIDPAAVIAIEGHAQREGVCRLHVAGGVPAIVVRGESEQVAARFADVAEARRIFERQESQRMAAELALATHGRDHEDDSSTTSTTEPT